MKGRGLRAGHGCTLEGQISQGYVGGFHHWWKENALEGFKPVKKITLAAL